MKTIYLIRHVEAEGNIFRRAQGQCESLITKMGSQQVECLARRFESIHVDYVYSSDLLRARLTAGAVYVPKKLPLIVSKELREFGLGEWEGCPLAEWEMKNPVSRRQYSTIDPDFRCKGGETPPAVQARMLKVFWEIVGEVPEGSSTVIVGHGMSLRILINTLLGLGFDTMGRKSEFADNSAVTKIEIEGGNLNFVYRDDASHIPPELSTKTKSMKWIQKMGGKERLLYFRDADFSKDRKWLSDLFREQWIEEHGSIDGFDEEETIGKVSVIAQKNKNALRIAVWKESDVGIAISTPDFNWFYLLREYRDNRFGIQLVGEIVHNLRVLQVPTMIVDCPNCRIADYLEHYGFERDGLRCSWKLKIENISTSSDLKQM